MKLLSKLLLFFIPLTAIVLGTAILVARRQVNSILIGEVEQQGLALARNTALSLSMRFDSKNESEILAHLQQLKTLAGASYAMVLSPKGVVLAHTNVGESGKTYLDSLSERAVHSKQPLTQSTRIEGKPALDVSLPINENKEQDDFLFSAGDDTLSRRIGTLRLGVPLSETLKVRDKIFIWQISLLTAAVAVSATCLVFFILHTVLLPTRRLLKGISRVKEGRYGQAIPVSSNDELGRLTSSFNQMNEALSTTTVSKDYLDAVLGQMSDPLFVLKPDGIIQTVNKATTLFGFTEAELVGQSMQVLFPEEEERFQPPALARRLRGESFPDFEIPLKTKAGVSLTVLFSSSVLRDKAGTAVGLICAARDITERKKLETRMLQSDKLSAVGQLAAGVAHEINNPLGIILGFAQSIRAQMKPDDPNSMGLGFIEKEALRCKDLVQNLLLFSRASKTEQRDEIDLTETVEEALSLVTTQTRVKNIELVREFIHGLPTITANKNQIQQIVINLCNNAMDAMPDKGTLLVRTGMLSKNHMDWATLEVRDTGCGIPKEIQAKIFEPFFTTKEVGKGTGLGLSLIHEIVQKHRGTIETESVAGKGTSFTICLPIQPLRRAA